MTDKRRSDLIIGSLFAVVVFLGAFSLLIRGEPIEHAGPQTIAIYSMVAIIFLPLYFSPRARNLHEKFLENRIITAVGFLLCVVFLVAVILLFIQVLGAESQSSGFYIGNGFWIVIFGLGGGSGVISILRETDFV